MSAFIFRTYSGIVANAGYSAVGEPGGGSPTAPRQRVDLGGEGSSLPGPRRTSPVVLSVRAGRARSRREAENADRAGSLTGLAGPAGLRRAGQGGPDEETRTR